MKGVPAGTYKVTFEPNADYTSTQKEGVSVTTGQVSDIGTITIASH